MNKYTLEKYQFTANCWLCYQLVNGTKRTAHVVKGSERQPVLCGLCAEKLYCAMDDIYRDHKHLLVNNR